MFPPGPSRLLPTLPFCNLGSIRSKHGGNLRWQKVRPKLARIQKQPSPHFPRLPRPSGGASQSHPPDLVPIYIPTTSSVPLTTSHEDGYERDYGLRLHHSPPASAPSFVQGQVPSILRWFGGESVRLSGEERAPLIRDYGYGSGMGRGGVKEGWGKEVRGRMRELRGEGLSQREICRELDIPAEQAVLIPQIAPLSSVQIAEKQAELEEQQSRWGYRKRLYRESKNRRRLFW